jgi:hypothetical protein
LEVVGAALIFDPVALGLACSSDCGVELEGSAGQLVQLLYDPRRSANNQLELDLRSATNMLTQITAPYGAVTLGTAVPLPCGAWLLLSGVVGVGALSRIRRAA